MRTRKASASYLNQLAEVHVRQQCSEDGLCAADLIVITGFHPGSGSGNLAGRIMVACSLLSLRWILPPPPVSLLVDSLYFHIGLEVGCHLQRDAVFQSGLRRRCHGPAASTATMSPFSSLILLSCCGNSLFTGVLNCTSTISHSSACCQICHQLIVSVQFSILSGASFEQRPRAPLWSIFHSLYIYYISSTSSVSSEVEEYHLGIYILFYMQLLPLYSSMMPLRSFRWQKGAKQAKFCSLIVVTSDHADGDWI